MKKEAAKKPRKQESIPAEMSMVLGQLVLPMMLASEAIKKGLLAFVQQIGLLAYRELLEELCVVNSRTQALPEVHSN